MVNLRTRLFQAWFRWHRSLTLGVRAIVERSDGAILLVRHTYTPGWYLPGGGVERRETAGEALKRELREEAGIDLTGTPKLIGIYSNERIFPGDHVLLYRVSADDWAETEPQHGNEIAEIRWCNPASPPENVTPATRRRLDEIYCPGSSGEDW